MSNLTGSQKARIAIREFKAITDAMGIRGFYRPDGRFGKALETCLKTLSPEIYGSMSDPRIVELKGLEYVIDRLPIGIEECSKVILTEEDQFDDSLFKEIVPLKRRRKSYRISNNELCFIVSKGLSEIYDIITHMVFLNIEAQKIYRRMLDDFNNYSPEWRALEKVIQQKEKLDLHELDSAIWNLSIILGRSYHETRQTYEYLEVNKREYCSNCGLFQIIYNLGKKIEREKKSVDDSQIVYLTPSLMSIIGQQKYGLMWANHIKSTIQENHIIDRPLHIVSSNLHSVMNVIYGYAALNETKQSTKNENLYDFFNRIKDSRPQILEFAKAHGLYEIPDQSGTNIDCQIIDTSQLKSVLFHPEIRINLKDNQGNDPVILVMDYAFGTQAFELLETLLKPYEDRKTNIGSISIMGKAGILTGHKGDIMLANAHVCEGFSDNYIVKNDIEKKDFDTDVNVFTGTMVTVVGTSLQNRDILEMFRDSWNAVGLEMEGGHYQKAINAAIIKGYVPKNVKTRYAYYASDNPLETGSTLAAGALGIEGIKPTYMITRIILEKIFNAS